MLLLNLAATALMVAIVVASPAAREKKDDTAKKRDSRSCYVKGRLYRNGEVFSLGQRCITYRCLNGIYNFHEEGCEIFGKCWPADGNFRYKCRDYRCVVTDIGANTNHYAVRPLGRQMCEDYYGHCRSPGQRFPWNMEGTIKRDCTCQPSSSMISYYCFD